MNNQEDLVQLLTKIETDYPEIYTYLDEDPVTIGTANSQKISDRDMANYFDSLKEKLSQYKRFHKN
jgi:hypothetical protein